MASQREYLSESLAKLVVELQKIPSIGEKTAERIAFYLLKSPAGEAEKLAGTIVNLKKKILFCKICNTISEDELCHICSDEARDRSLICVVEDVADMITIEKGRAYRGVYHILHGSISPIDGINPEDLQIEKLILRVKEGKVKEVILATNMDAEGETTAIFISNILLDHGVKTTRIAYGIPVGASLEFMDSITVAKAIEGRRNL